MLRMRFTGRIVRPVLMVMVIVVTMPVLVFHGLVDVLMIMPFGQMQPQAISIPAKANWTVKLSPMRQWPRSALGYRTPAETRVSMEAVTLRAAA